MTLDRLGHWRLPVLAAQSILIALGLVVAILLLGRAPSALDGSPSPRPSASAASSSATPGLTPESAVRAFYEAFSQARETDGPSIVEPYVNGTDSSAYLTAAGFLEGQRGVGKASVVTVLELSDFQVTIGGTRATVRFTLREGGYDIDLKTGEPLETPMVLPEKRVEAELVLVGGTWLVDGYGAIK